MYLSWLDELFIDDPNLSFIEPLEKEAFAKLEDGRIAFKKDDEIFDDDEEDKIWNSYL